MADYIKTCTNMKWQSECRGLLWTWNNRYMNEMKWSYTRGNSCESKPFFQKTSEPYLFDDPLCRPELQQPWVGSPSAWRRWLTHCHPSSSRFFPDCGRILGTRSPRRWRTTGWMLRSAWRHSLGFTGECCDISHFGNVIDGSALKPSSYTLRRYVESYNEHEKQHHRYWLTGTC